MAPELAIREIRRLEDRRVVLDPMVGSGTVVREASEYGHRAVGFDVDPLAVLMASVWTSPVDDELVGEACLNALKVAKRATAVSLPWIDRDLETSAFVDYWFAEKQKTALRALAWALRDSRRPASTENQRALNVLRLALSKIIVTKDVGASLARDVSHSRPHRVADSSSYDVFEGFERAVGYLRKVLRDEPPKGGVRVRFGDARCIRVKRESVDLVLTSPPYLNAIDYLRGHRLSLVWLGHSLGSLRTIRAEAIGAERKRDAVELAKSVETVRDAMASTSDLKPRHLGMVERYSIDLLKMMKAIHRALRAGGRAVLVVGNSCLRGTFIRSSAGVIAAGKHVGLRLRKEVERELPESKRYLPLHLTADPALTKRMRTETVLTFGRSED